MSAGLRVLLVLVACAMSNATWAKPMDPGLFPPKGWPPIWPPPVNPPGPPVGPKIPGWPCIPGIDGCPLDDPRHPDKDTLAGFSNYMSEKRPHVSSPVHAACRVQAVTRAIEGLAAPTMPSLSTLVDVGALAGRSLDEVRAQNAATGRTVTEWVEFATTHGSHVARIDNMICGAEALNRKLPVVLADLKAGVEWPHEHPILIGKPHVLPTDEAWRWMPEYYKLAYGVKLQAKAPSGFDFTPFPGNAVCDLTKAQRSWTYAADERRKKCALDRARGLDRSKSCERSLDDLLAPKAPPGPSDKLLPPEPEPGPVVCLDDFGQGSGCDDDPQVRYWPYYSRVAAEPKGDYDVRDTEGLISDVNRASKALRAARAKLEPLVAPVDSAIAPGLATYSRTLALEARLFRAEQSRVDAEKVELANLDARLKASRSQLDQRNAKAASLASQEAALLMQLTRDESDLAEKQTVLRTSASRADGALAAAQAASGLDSNGYARQSESEAAYVAFRAALKAQSSASVRRVQTRRQLSQVRRQLAEEKSAMAVLRLELGMRQPEHDRRLATITARQVQLDKLKSGREDNQTHLERMSQVFLALADQKLKACEAYLGSGKYEH